MHEIKSSDEGHFLEAAWPMIHSNKGLCSEAFKAYDKCLTTLVAVVVCLRETHSHSSSLKRITTSDTAVYP
jgi:hypothetical protein